MESVECNAWRQCGVWRLERRVGGWRLSLECGVYSVECRVWCVKCGVQSVDCGVLGVKYEVSSVKDLQLSPYTWRTHTLAVTLSTTTKLCGFPYRDFHDARGQPEESQRLKRRHGGASKQAFRVRLPPILIL